MAWWNAYYCDLHDVSCKTNMFLCAFLWLLSIPILHLPLLLLSRNCHICYVETSVQTPGLLSCNNATDMWVGWRNGTGHLGSGLIPFENEIIKWKNPFPPLTDFVSVSGSATAMAMWKVPRGKFVSKLWGIIVSVLRGSPISMMWDLTVKSVPTKQFWIRGLAEGLQGQL